MPPNELVNTQSLCADDLKYGALQPSGLRTGAAIRVSNQVACRRRPWGGKFLIVVHCSVIFGPQSAGVARYGLYRQYPAVCFMYSMVYVLIQEIDVPCPLMIWVSGQRRLAILLFWKLVFRLTYAANVRRGQTTAPPRE